MMTCTRAFAAVLASVLLICFANPSSAGTLHWDFETSLMDGLVMGPSDAILAHGSLVTNDELDQNGQYQVLSISGFYGPDEIIGLSDRPLRLDGKEAENTVSVAYDWFKCQTPGWTWNGQIGSPHFSCYGLAFATAMGEVNLAFGGATYVLLGYSGTSEPFTLVWHQITRVNVPEPGTLALLGLGLAGLGLSRRRDSN